MNRPSPFCSCIAAVLRQERASGNTLGQAPSRAGWPQAGSVFAALKQDFRSDPERWASPLSYRVCNDPRYGWYGECYCETHHHLLVAGEPRHET